MSVSKRNKLPMLLIISITLLTLITGCSKIPNKPNNPSNSNQNNTGSKENTNNPQASDKDDSNNSSTVDDNNKTSDNASKDTNTQTNDSKVVLLNKIMSLGKERKVIKSELKAKENVIEDEEKKWGRPEKSDWIPEAKGMYSTYPSKNIDFGFNKGSQIFEIKSFDSQIKKISLSDIKKALGFPAYDVKIKGEEIIGYVANNDFKLLLVFPEPTTKNPDPLMDHYSVFYPKGTANSMADDPGREW